MSAIRQDAWSADDDLILAEVTLRNIREGSTQLAAFDEVGSRIGRTSAACGFRWNSSVRKKYESSIQIAKAQRQQRHHMKRSGSISNQAAVNAVFAEEDMDFRHDSTSEESISIEAVIRFLRQWKGTYQKMERQIKHLERELRDKSEQLNDLRVQHDKVTKAMSEVQTDYSVVNDDYKALIQIMDRARKMAFLSHEEDEHRPRFKMDASGNLERVE